MTGQDAAKYRKRPVIIWARRWTGGEYQWLNDFCGRNWSRADAQDIAFDDTEQLVVWNTKERQWLQVPVGHWIIRGLHAELYPCAPDIFEASYEPVE